MSTRRLVAWITFLAVFAMAARVSVDTDTWWHLRTGQWIIENGTVPRSDPFSYTRLGQPWQPPGWLVQVPMFWIYRLAGPGGLNIWTALMVTLSFYFVWRVLRGGMFLRALIIVLAAATSGVYWAARPYLVTFLLAAVYLSLLEDYRWKGGGPDETGRRAGRRLWWLPVLMVVWVNSHGGFAVGFLLLAVYLGALVVQLCVSWAQPRIGNTGDGDLPTPPGFLLRQIARLGLVGAAMLLAACINPYGPAQLAYPFMTVSIGALQDYILEWQSPDFHNPQALPFIWLALAVFAAVGASRRRLALSDFFLFGGFLTLGLMAWRNVALFALAAAPVLARHADDALAPLAERLGWRGLPDRPRSPAQGRLNRLLLAVLLLAVGLKAWVDFSAQANRTVFKQTLPVGAVDYLQREAPPGRLFNSYNWGAYLLWELPEYPVFIDGRTDLYNDDVIGEWLAIMRAEPGWEAGLERWGVNAVLVEPGAPLAAALEQAGWEKAYLDEVAVVMIRR